jgi:hypothetical protein
LRGFLFAGDVPACGAAHAINARSIRPGAGCTLENFFRPHEKTPAEAAGAAVPAPERRICHAINAPDQWS